MKQIFEFLWRYKIYVIIILIISSIIGFSVYKNAHSAPKLEFDKATKQAVSDIVSESGNIQSIGQAEITSPIEGVISQIFVSNGDRVSTDQALFSIQSTASELEKQAAFASLLAAQVATTTAKQSDLTLGGALDTAKAALYSAQNSYNITNKGYHNSSTNPATNRAYKILEVQAAQANLDAAKQGLTLAEEKYAESARTIASAEAAEKSAQLNYDSKTTFTVKAPSSGIVSNISVGPGDKVSLSAQAVTVPMIISRANLQNNLQFKTQINENDIAKLKVGQTASITVDAVKEKKFGSEITNIDLIGTNTSGVISYNVYFKLNENDEAIRPGMSGNVDIEVTKHENVLTVSNAAIKPYQDGKAVQVIDPTQPKKNGQPALKYIVVKTGIKTSDRTEILEGLTEGMEVVINNTGNQFKSNLFGG